MDSQLHAQALFERGQVVTAPRDQSHGLSCEAEALESGHVEPGQSVTTTALTEPEIAATLRHLAYQWLLSRVYWQTNICARLCAHAILRRFAEPHAVRTYIAK